MKIIDISWPLELKTTLRPGEAHILFEPTKIFSQDKSREHSIQLAAHTGTHIDSPSSIFRDGKTVDHIDLCSCVGLAHVIDMAHVDDCIKWQDLENYDIREHDIILLKTKNSDMNPTAKYTSNFVYLDYSAAEYLAEQKVKTVGFDYITIEPEKEFGCAHRILLHHEITLIEGLRLYNIEQGVYFFFCLPLYVIGLEAAPSRAVLLDVGEDIAKNYNNEKSP